MPTLLSDQNVRKLSGYDFQTVHWLLPIVQYLFRFLVGNIIRLERLVGEGVKCREV